MNNLEYINPHIEKEVRANINVTFSGLFKRHRMKVPLVGDYIILRQIAKLMGKEGVLLNKFKVDNACRYSRDYMELDSSRSEGRPFWVNSIMEINKEHYDQR
jgi:hypothetical protein